jgi:hypothetical protein
MAKKVIIDIPGSLREYSITQAQKLYDCLQYMANEKEPDLHPLMEKIMYISAVTGLDVDLLKRLDAIKAINPAYDAIMAQLRFPITEPPKELKFDGQTFILSGISSDEWNAGRLMDADNHAIDVDQHPEYMCALCYIEKGKKYGYPEHEGGCMPLEDRAAIMLKHVNGMDYFNIRNFFLRKYLAVSPGFLILNLAKAQMQLDKAEKLMHPHG